jgi:hypothetical protein
MCRATLRHRQEGIVSALHRERIKLGRQMESTLTARLEYLIAKEELHDLNMRYCRAADRTDIELWRTVFHADATDDHGIFRGNAWEFGDMILPLMRERFAGTHHFIGNERFVIEGDRAEGEVSVFSLKSPKSNPRQAELVTARYLDRYERRNGEWRISHRQAVVDPWDSQQFAEAAPNLWGENKFTIGANDRSDPSFSYKLVGASINGVPPGRGRDPENPHD